MFEITKIRLNRIKKITIYGFALYGMMAFAKSCSSAEHTNTSYHTIDNKIEELKVSKLENKMYDSGKLYKI